MPIPGKPLLWLVAALAVAGLGAIFEPALTAAAQVAAALALAVAAGDALAGIRRRGRVRVQREVPLALPVGTRQTVTLRLSIDDGGAAGWLHDRHPEAFVATGLPLRFRLEPGRWLRPTYSLMLTERGLQTFTGTDLRLESPLRLWLIPETLAVHSDVRVFPNFARITQYTLLATDNRLSQIGVLRRRRRGEGIDFHQLRDYRQEDSTRQIDWKASQRVGRLISREYQDERDQQLVFLLDCGGRMRARDGDLSHFDHTLNALLLLAYVALRQGDAVGLATFGHGAPRFLPPRKSVATVNRLLNGVYDLQPTLQAPDFLAAGESLLRRLTKRALVVLVTNLRDEDDEGIAPAMLQLRRRHSVTLASLREPVLESIVAAPVTGLESALTRSAALEYMQARRRQAAILRRNGVQVLDVSPRELPVALINHYWQRKRAGNL
jgi:uncharacterized protein (DUF58 family)